MKKILSLRVQFYCLWIFVSLLQAQTTELFDDEAYYWVYSQFLDWGYFDHPPMIAVWIKWGSFFFSGELGVRLMVVLFGTASIYLVEQLTRPKDLKLFYAIVLQIAILQIGNIIAVPDIPLLFFTALFFWGYELFLSKTNWVNAIWLGIIIALLLYSKYHGLLILVATLLSNWGLLKKTATWLVILLAILLFMPHVLWQLEHGLPSLYYHLFERVSPPYSVSFTTDFLAGQLLIAGPLIGWLIIWSAFNYRPVNQTQKAMKWSMVLVYVLFLISSFKSRTEANWTVPLLVPLVVLGYQHIAQHELWKKWIYRLFPISVVLIVLVRVFMLLDEPLINNLPKDEFHYNKEWTKAVREKANGKPVVFTNSYQRASKYWFYTGDTAFSLNTHLYRRSNYNFWPLELQLQKRTVFVVGSKGSSGLRDSLLVANKSFSIDTIQQFVSYAQIVLEQQVSKLSSKNNSIAVDLQLTALTPTILQNALTNNPELVMIIYRDKKQQPLLVHTGVKLTKSSADKISFEIKLPQLKKTSYPYRWGLQGSYVEPSINSRVYTLINE